ncbi:MAG: 4Fe-4S dicluster domain-containing protein [Deltaproteobacteria bacterium]|nr:4Fe-4S dicluster domain-containing protein [Deltaproteobacteria bacterium]
MFFDSLLYGSLIVFIFGSVYKSYTWVSRQITGPQVPYSTGERISKAVKGILSVIFSARILVLIKVLILDVILQRRILKEDALRWVMHMLIFVGFIALLIIHAFATENGQSHFLFDEFYSTAQPFLFLRNLFGLMVFAGVAIAIYRRRVLKVPRLRTNAMDVYAIWIVAIIMISGFLLEGAKIVSHNEYQRMVEDYGDTDDPAELKALEAYWVKNFGLVSPEVAGPFDEDLLTEGQELHEMSCQSCHAAPAWAFIGFNLSKGMRPMAAFLDDAQAAYFLWVIHILACFIGLAYLPFSKMFHLFTTPLSLMANAVMDKKRSHPANILTRQLMELDACTHCGTCSLRCSAYPAFDALSNDCILPSEKLQTLRKLAAGKNLSEPERRALLEGVYICTNCDRCTVVCPSGINLKDLWVNVREGLLQIDSKGESLMLSGYSFVRGLNKSDLKPEVYEKPLDLARSSVSKGWPIAAKVTSLRLNGDESSQTASVPFDADTFRACYTCQNCTTVCPVVALSEKPEETLGLLPHQIMCSLGLGLTDMACGANMIWDCVTCYQCQEHCPQLVAVTDILYQLKNIAIKGHRRRTAA